MRKNGSMSDYEIRRRGWDALARELGLEGATRFLMSYSGGVGDYVSERRHWFGKLSVSELASQVRSTEQTLQTSAGAARSRRRAA